MTKLNKFHLAVVAVTVIAAVSFFIPWTPGNSYITPLNSGGGGGTVTSITFGGGLTPVTITGSGSVGIGTFSPTNGTMYAASVGLGTVSPGTLGQVLTSQGASSPPIYADVGGGSVTAVSIANANGFTGSSSGGATPALTISTTATGILYSNGTSVAAAVAMNFPTLNQNTTGSAGSVPASGVTGTTLASNVVTSSLTTIGTIIAGVWNGTAIDLANYVTGNLGVSHFNSGTSASSSTYWRGDGTWSTISTGTSTPPSIQTYSATGTCVGSCPTAGATAGYMFTMPSATVGLGCVFSNSGHNYTVINAVTSATQIWMSGAVGATLTADILTYVSGSGCNGGSNISYSSATAYSNYTTPTSPVPVYIKIRLVGAGSGGAAGGNPGATALAGTPSIFGPGYIIGNSGLTAVSASLAGTGGTTSIVSPAAGIGVNGGVGTSAFYSNTGNLVYPPGGTGGGGWQGLGFGSGASAGTYAGATAGVLGGGGGGGSTQGTYNYTGQGGCGGGYVEAQIVSLSATYPVIVGVGGIGEVGSPGSYGPGANGGDGLIEINEYYQ